MMSTCPSKPMRNCNITTFIAAITLSNYLAIIAILFSIAISSIAEAFISKFAVKYSSSFVGFLLLFVVVGFVIMLVMGFLLTFLSGIMGIK